MAKFTRQTLADYLYNRLPRFYVTEDKNQLLKRFLDTFAEAGFDPLLQETISITDLLDVDKCPSEFLPQLCRMYGYEYTLEIPELFQRRLLKHIVEMYKRKGTKSVVRFIARELTGFESEIIENKDFTPEHEELTGWTKRFEHYRNFILKLTAPYEDSSLFNKEEIVIKIVNNFLPTNSQVLVVTSYWLKEESDIIKHMKESFTEKIKDMSTEVYPLGRISESECAIIKMAEDSEKLNFRELNDTNFLLNRDTMLVTNTLNGYDKVRVQGKKEEIIIY